MIKFVGFYVTAEWVYEQLEKRFGMKKSEMPVSQQLMVTFASGYWAGIFCAIATQPPGLMLLSLCRFSLSE